MNQICDSKKCTGCSACLNICSRNAVQMLPSSDGFVYPFIDNDKCIDCGACSRICPINNLLLFKESLAKALSMKCKDDCLREKSSSGGVFSLIANSILSMNGAVVGAVFTDNFKRVKHVIIEDNDDLPFLRKSKYVQSEIGTIYRVVQNKLNKGQKVLFSGTGCQIAGLKAFLQKDYANLYTIDVVCHGIPSQLFWEEYLKQFSFKYGSEIVNVDFRDKRHGINEFGINIQFAKKNYYKHFNDDKYYCLFQKNLSLRESCFNCCYKSIKGISDISLGDLWGGEVISPNIYDHKGVSFVLVHSAKGEKLIEALQDFVDAEPIDLDLAIKNNPNIAYSSKRPKDRSTFLKLVADGRSVYALKRFSKKPLKKMIKKALIKIGLFKGA